ncbi:MAG: phosphoribosylglycinamide formyltransferase [Thermomicrobiales bacterium]|nr:phosphoribosylglycinamide formyltransferase [Thermomicrobiales bacterium]
MSESNGTARLAVLLSGSGRTLENLLRAIERGTLSASVVAVVSSKPGVRGLEIAQAAGIPATVIERRGFADDAAFTSAILDWLAPFAPNLIVHAGFLRKLHIPTSWEGRMINIHPSLIPESGAMGKGFWGDRVHTAVIASGAKWSGATVHLVDNEYDHGPVLAKAIVPVMPDDTTEALAARVFAAECRLYPQAIADYLRENPWLLEPISGEE